ncbi:MAG: hypothetical protein MI745_03500 [Pseudomonadales bacterium]|nr:hypothetical protein [Pseudomonadales bacterium]
MRHFAGILLSLPLAMMLMGLLAAAVPAPWQSWLVLQLVLGVVVWMLLSLLVALPEKAWLPVTALLVANLAAWLALQTTSLYGGGA